MLGLINMVEGGKKGKGVFIVSLMFIGMGIGFILIDIIGGVAFVASMFIGMGLGFILDTFIEIRESKISFTMPLSVSGIVMVLVGLSMITGGLIVMFVPSLLEKIMPYMIGVIFIAVGAFILAGGFRILKSIL